MYVTAVVRIFELGNLDPITHSSKIDVMRSGCKSRTLSLTFVAPKVPFGVLASGI